MAAAAEVETEADPDVRPELVAAAVAGAGLGPDAAEAQLGIGLLLAKAANETAAMIGVPILPQASSLNATLHEHQVSGQIAMLCSGFAFVTSWRSL